MNNFKNFVITVLSVIILIQSAFLLYFISHRAPREKALKVERKQVAPIVEEIKQRQEVRPIIEPPVVVIPTPSVSQGKIALVLDDWGYNLKNRDFITDNDFRITLSILPFKAYSTHVAQLAYHKNKDVIIHMPMEPQHKENYGLEENTIMTTMDKSAVLKILNSAFEVVPYAKGLSNHMGSKATEDTRLMTIVMQYLKQRDLFFLDSFVTANTVCPVVSRKLRLGFSRRDIFIDNESGPAYIKAQVLKLAQKAKRAGFAIGIGHDRANTIAVLKVMIPELEKQGYQFVNLSEVIDSAE